jgi:hypothetical protein
MQNADRKPAAVVSNTRVLQESSGGWTNVRIQVQATTTSN